MQKTILLGLTIWFLSCSNEVKKYYDSGRLKEIHSYKKVEQIMILHGEWTGFHENGQISTTGFYESGNKVGDWKKFDDQGNLKEKATYLDGQKNGEAITYNNKGTPYEKIVYVNGIKNGSYINYYDNDQLATKGEYLLDKKNGLWTNYYSNGTIQKTGKWKNGKKIGPHRTYDENGNKALFFDYDFDGSENGFVESWNEWGILFSKCTIKNGHLDVCYTYKKDGSVEEVIKKGL